MYHDTPAAVKADYFSVAGESLKSQFNAIASSSLRAVSLETVLQASHGHALGDRLVAITFDDGHRSNYEVALPILAEHGATATIFVVSSWVGSPGYCTWQELRMLHQAGWSIQSHTKSHPFLSQLSEQRVREELEQSRAELEQHLGAPVVTLALPNGDFPRSALSGLITECGYQWVATSRWGPNGIPQLRERMLRRYTVRRSTDQDRFRELANGHSGAFSREGIRLKCLSALRGALGPERYRRARSAALSVLD